MFCNKVGVCFKGWVTFKSGFVHFVKGLVDLFLALLKVCLKFEVFQISAGCVLCKCRGVLYQG